MNKALFLDLDGTVRETKSGAVSPSSPKDQVLLPGRKEKIHAYKDDGYKIIAVTNQGGVGLGYLTHENVKECLHAINADLGFVFDDMLYEPSKPADDHPRRKPNPGMILEAAEKHNINLEKSLMVGDMKSDHQAAYAAGVPFEFAQSFFRKKET